MDNQKLIDLLADLRTDLTDLRTDLADLRTDLANLMTDLVDLRTDLADLRTDLADLMTDLADLVDLFTDRGPRGALLIYIGSPTSPLEPSLFFSFESS